MRSIALVLVLGLVLVAIAISASAQQILAEKQYSGVASIVVVKLGSTEAGAKIAIVGITSQGDSVMLSDWVSVEDKAHSMLVIPLKRPATVSKIQVIGDGAQVLDIHIGHACVDLPIVGRVCIGTPPEEIAQQVAFAMQMAHEQALSQIQQMQQQFIMATLVLVGIIVAILVVWFIMRR